MISSGTLWHKNLGLLSARAQGKARSVGKEEGQDGLSINSTPDACDKTFAPFLLSPCFFLLRYSLANPIHTRSHLPSSLSRNFLKCSMVFPYIVLRCSPGALKNRYSTYMSYMSRTLTLQIARKIDSWKEGRGLPR